jgi:hypothetical protein
LEFVTHTCGQRLYRHESGGVRKLVLYSDDGRREIDDCPKCGENLCDADLHNASGEPVLPLLPLDRPPAPERPPDTLHAIRHGSLPI